MTQATVVRPPGHHATRDMGVGFRAFFNAAIAGAWMDYLGLMELRL